MSNLKKQRATIDRKGSRESSNRAGRSKKKQPPKNRYMMEKETDSVSTAAKKLKTSHEDYEVEVNPFFEYRFIDFFTVFTALSQILVCKTCGTQVRFCEKSVRGLGYQLVVQCEKCTQTVINAIPLIDKNAYDINRRIVFAMKLLGLNYTAIKKFCAFMNLPTPIFKSFYKSVVHNIAVSCASVREHCMKKAVQEEKQIAQEQGQVDSITVSGDGSWHKRGFSSLHGIASLIGWFTGKVIDVIVKSKYCKVCEFWEKKSDTMEYKDWAENHQNECQANHEGSSGKMEVDGIIEMFCRSESLYGVKYSNYIGDGDSKTFKGILDCEPYDNFIVKKKECIGHVQKRMGTRLRNLKKNTKGLSGKGKLTGKVIDELALYYGLAIRRNTDSIENMKREIWATLYHKISTDEKPQHQFCPVGETSWCSYQKAEATNTLSSYKHKPSMSDVVFNAMKPVYEELSKDDLLTRCLGGYTQNSNESLNASVWALAPKTQALGKESIDIAVSLAICNFNDGYRTYLQMMKVLNLTIGRNCYEFCEEHDAARKKKAEERLTEKAKEARRSLLAVRKEADETDDLAEGQLYGAGIAD